MTFGRAIFCGCYSRLFLFLQITLFFAHFAAQIRGYGGRRGKDLGIIAILRVVEYAWLLDLTLGPIIRLELHEIDLGQDFGLIGGNYRRLLGFRTILLFLCRLLPTLICRFGRIVFIMNVELHDTVPLSFLVFKVQLLDLLENIALLWVRRHPLGADIFLLVLEIMHQVSLILVFKQIFN